MAPQNLPEISICVCTHLRPALLLKLLESLAAQTIDMSRNEIIVVDNDVAGSAEKIVESFAHRFPSVLIHYSIEPTPGISFARNKTVAMASGNTLAFIDDDEWADCNWLSNLTQTMQMFSADAIIGPVIPHYPESTPRWIIDSRFFERPRCDTGTRVGSGNCRTANAMVNASLMKSRQPKIFSERFALSGGEDTDCFKWLENNGAKLVWCDSAIVNELVPTSRQNLTFILERCLRTSACYWREEYTNRSHLWAIKKSLLGCLGGSAFVLLGGLSLPFGLSRSVRFWSKAMKGFGRIVGLSNLTLVGYGKVP